MGQTRFALKAKMMNRELHACNECEKSFKKKENLKCHISAVHRTCLSHCDKCGKEFKNPDYLRNHVNRFHAAESAICDVCKKVFKSKANLYNHKRDVHERVENLNCSLCDEPQKNYSYLSRHTRRFCKLKEANKAKNMDVDLSPKPTNTNAIIAPTVSIFENDKIREQIIEPFSAFAKKLNKINVKNAEYPIEDNSIHFANYFGVEEILEPATKIFTKIEETVDWTFMDLEAEDGFQIKEGENGSNLKEEKVKESVKDEIKVNKNLHIEPFCPKTIEAKIMEPEIKEEMDRDNSDESKINPIQVISEFKCTQCEKIFRKQKYLNSHIRDIHTEVEMLSCEYCSEQFKNSSLKRHIQSVHTTERSSCDECGKMYSNAKHLKDHIRAVHKGEELLCDLCSKTFKGNSYLANHKRRFHNSVDEGLECDECDKKCKSKNNLYLHIKAVHTVENLPCGECGKIYRNDYLLKKHFKHKHSIKLVL